MIDVSMQYLGLKLSSPIVVASTPLSESIDNIRRMEDAGALKLLATDMAVPHGIAFSPDGKRLYVNDTRAGEIRV